MATRLLLELSESSNDSCVATVYDENDRDIRRMAKSKKIEKQKTDKFISFTTSIEPMDLKSTPRDKRSQLVLRGLTVTDGIKL